jgi:asparagine synthase (glutamine-hydrolysing)
MAHGLEARAPLLDHGLLEFALRLPDEFLVDGNGGKRILRDVLGRYVPRSLFERPKQGFTLPLDRWFENGLRSSVEGLATSERLAATHWFRPDGIRDLVSEHIAGERDHSQRIYNLLVLERWLQSD